LGLIAVKYIAHCSWLNSLFLVLYAKFIGSFCAQQ